MDHQKRALAPKDESTAKKCRAVRQNGKCAWNVSGVMKESLAVGNVDSAVLCCSRNQIHSRRNLVQVD